MGRLLSYPEWRSLPGRVSFVWCLLDLVLFAFLWTVGDRGAAGALVEISAWTLGSLAVPRVLKDPFGPGKYFGTVLLLSLIEESIAYATGGGLHGAATSLPEDWTRAVPVFLGLGVGLYVAVRTTGLTPGESFVSAGVAGLAIEIGLGASFSPIALGAFGGVAMWIYGTIVALPVRRTGAPSAPWVRAGLTTLLLTGGAIAGGIVGLVLP